MPIIAAGHDRRSGPFLFTRPGTLSSWVIAHQTGSDLRIIAREREIAFGANQVVLIQPRTAYRLESTTSAKAWQQVWAIFTPKQEWLRLLQWPESLPGIALLDVRPAAHGSEIAAAAESLARDWQTGIPESSALADNALERLLLYCRLASPNSAWTKLSEPVRLVLEHLSDHGEEPCDLARLAKAAHCSPSYLSHVFRAQLGETPMRYLERQRIERAKRLLLSTNLPIRAIASAVGFDNAFHFSTRFRAVAGRSPKMWRQKPD